MHFRVGLGSRLGFPQDFSKDPADHVHASSFGLCFGYPSLILFQYCILTLPTPLRHGGCTSWNARYILHFLFHYVNRAQPVFRFANSHSLAIHHGFFIPFLWTCHGYFTTVGSLNQVLPLL
jgi:hypothetical protein